MNWVSGLRELPKRVFIGALRFFFFFAWIKEKGKTALSPRIVQRFTANRSYLGSFGGGGGGGGGGVLSSRFVALFSSSFQSN